MQDGGGHFGAILGPPHHGDCVVYLVARCPKVTAVSQLRLSQEHLFVGVILKLEYQVRAQMLSVSHPGPVTTLWTDLFPCAKNENSKPQTIHMLLSKQTRQGASLV